MLYLLGKFFKLESFYFLVKHMSNNGVKFLLVLILLFLGLILIKPKSLTATILLKQEAQQYREKASWLEKKGNIDQAIKYYQKSILLDSSYIFVYNKLGILYEKKGWLNRAEQMYLKAIKKNPLYLPAHNNLAYLYESEGKIGRAIIHWRIRARLGDSKNKWTKLAKRKLVKYSKVREFPPKKRKKVKPIELQKAREYIKKGERFYGQGNYEKAVLKFKQARELIPENEMLNQLVDRVKFENYLNDANTFLKQGRYQKALQNINNAIGLEPQNKEAKDLKQKIMNLLRSKK